MTLVDSSVWIDYFNGTATAQTDALDGMLGQERIAIGDLILSSSSRTWGLRSALA